MQQILKSKNIPVDCIPCADHSLNLVGRSAVDVILKQFHFYTLQRLCTFLHHWYVMMTNSNK